MTFIKKKKERLLVVARPSATEIVGNKADKNSPANPLFLVLEKSTRHPCIINFHVTLARPLYRSCY
ncbi:MAG: hypothetical protein ACRCXC_11325 [Legionella sp.]